MRKLVLALVLLTSSCTTCPANKKIADTLVSTFTGHYYCGGYNAMYDVVIKVVEKKDYCGLFDTTKIVPTLPTGSAWSPKAMCCYSSIADIKRFLKKGFPPNWECKRKLDDYQILNEYLIENCQRL